MFGQSDRIASSAASKHFRWKRAFASTPHTAAAREARREVSTWRGMQLFYQHARSRDLDTDCFIGLCDLPDGGDISCGPIVTELRLLLDEIADACPGAAHHVFEA